MTPSRLTPGRKGWLVPVLVGVLAALGCEASVDVERPGPDRGGNIPTIAEKLPDLALHFEELESSIEQGTLGSTEELIERCRDFYTRERMAEIEAVLPGWGHMASLANGKTLWHVNVAMVALLRLEEYQAMTPRQQAVQQWIVLLHDIAKEPVNGRDHRHAFRSGARAGKILPGLGFPVEDAYQPEFPDWFALADTASRFDEEHGFDVNDNSRLSAILAGAERIFPEPTRPAVTAIALHQSITSLAAWPVQAPLTDEQVVAFVDDDVLPPLVALTLADSGGWNLFDPPTLEAMYEETRAVFRNLPRVPTD